jgi:mRNA interferase MazF
MLLAGDVVNIDFGTPIGSEAGFIRPAIVLTANAFLALRPSTIFVVPLTSTVRLFPSHVSIAPDLGNKLQTDSIALVEQMRSVSTQRCGEPLGNIGPATVHQLLDILSMITGMP